MSAIAYTYMWSATGNQSMRADTLHLSCSCLALVAASLLIPNSSSQAPYTSAPCTACPLPYCHYFVSGLSHLGVNPWWSLSWMSAPPFTLTTLEMCFPHHFRFLQNLSLWKFRTDQATCHGYNTSIVSYSLMKLKTNPCPLRWRQSAHHMPVCGWALLPVLDSMASLQDSLTPISPRTPCSCVCACSWHSLGPFHIPLS